MHLRRSQKSIKGDVETFIFGWLQLILFAYVYVQQWMLFLINNENCSLYNKNVFQTMVFDHRKITIKITKYCQSIICMMFNILKGFKILLALTMN